MTGFPVWLRPDNWTSGDVFWLINAIGAPEAAKVMVTRIGAAMFKGKTYELRVCIQPRHRMVTEQVRHKESLRTTARYWSSRPPVTVRPGCV